MQCHYTTTEIVYGNEVNERFSRQGIRWALIFSWANGPGSCLLGNATQTAMANKPQSVAPPCFGLIPISIEFVPNREVTSLRVCSSAIEYNESNT